MTGEKKDTGIGQHHGQRDRMYPYIVCPTITKLGPR